MHKSKDNRLQKSYNVIAEYINSKQGGCPMNISIHHSETICNSLRENHLYEIRSEPEQNYVPSVLLAMFSPDYHGKTVDLEEYSDYHRTSIQCH